jgi:tetratricopeptide (TPR) repeat protein
VSVPSTSSGIACFFGIAAYIASKLHNQIENYRSKLSEQTAEQPSVTYEIKKGTIPMDKFFLIGGVSILVIVLILAYVAYKQAIRIKPDDARAHSNLGVAYLIIGDRGSALNEYKILKDMDSDLANGLFNLIYK